MSQSARVSSIQRKPVPHYLDGRDLDWLLDEYLDASRKRVSNPGTVEGYGYKLRWFRRWWAETGPLRDWLICADDFGEFEFWLRSVVSERTGDVLSYNTRHDVIRRLREALIWAHTHEYTDQNYARWVTKAQGGPEERRAAPAHMLWRLMEAAMMSASAARDRTILALFIGTGLRRGEVVNLNVEDIVIEADQSGYATVYGKKTQARPTGKREVAIDSTTGKYLVKYLDACGYETGPLFRGRFGGRIAHVTIYRAVKRAVVAAGLEDYVQGPHDLRRAFATHWLRRRRGEGSADLLRRQLGHSKYAMTTKYTLADVNDIRVEMVSPLNRRTRE